jgi:selenocysteine-specific elongation factor
MKKRRLILGTAGHVDHGKTKLVTLLTGWDTDRLKEEKDRGISIELGFAPLQLDGDTMIGIVDVPGHERFVKHMVAGAGGIDMAILVVAADEGVMPQTREHLEVLRSLSVTHGVVVVTKVDLLSSDLRPILYDDISQLVEGTFLEVAPVVETSVVTGEGMDSLKQTLGEIAATVPDRDTAGPFRLAIDRVFHKQGIGVVVTGSCYSGSVAIGDSLRVLPSERTVRVREIQSFGERRQQGYAGERLAIALQGAKLDQVSRGDMLATSSCFAVSYMLDTRIYVAEYAKFELKQRERVRIHHGAREVFGRMVLFEVDNVRSGEECLAQLRLETPIVAGEGDYFVLRKYSPSRVVGGGRVIDPQADKHRKSDATVVENLKIMEEGDPADRAAKQLRAAGLAGVKAAELDEATTRMLLDDERVVVFDKRLFDPEVLRTLAEEIHALVTSYNEKYPLRYGLDKEELRQRVGFPHPAATFNRVLEGIAMTSGIFIKGNSVRVDTKAIQLPPDVSHQVDEVETLVKEAGYLLQRQADIAAGRKGTIELAESLQFLRDMGRVERVAADLYIHAEVLASCVARLKEWFQSQPTISVPEFKNLLGVTRKQAIPLLEYLDSNRYTSRQQNVRVPGTGLV